MAELKVFITGATGYIGGAVLTNLLKKHKDGKSFHVSTLIRDSAQEKIFRDLNVKPVLGSLDDVQVIEKESYESDIVINTANCDHEASATAIVKGLTRRAHDNKHARKPLLIHTSGTGVLIDHIKTGDPTDFFFSESTLGDYDGVDVAQPHRIVDRIVLAAGKSKDIDIIIVCPPMIYGEGDGPFNQHSQQIPKLIKLGISNKYVGHIGKGNNKWNNVHILDLADLYILLLEKALEGKAPVNHEGYYFAENGIQNFAELNHAIARALHKRGVVESATSRTFTDEEANKSFGNPTYLRYFGGNSQGHALKGKQLGWAPHRAPIVDTIDGEVAHILSSK